MNENTTALIAAVGATVLLALALATIRAERADARASQIDQADRAAGVTYVMKRPLDGPAYIERTGPARRPGEPLGNIETVCRQDHVKIRQAAVIGRRQRVPLVQVEVTR